MKLFDYDDRSVESIYEYAKQLEGMSFQDILDEYENSRQKEYINRYDKGSFDTVKEPETQYYAVSTNSNARGQLGNLIERYYFGYGVNGRQEADFSKTGVELKQTPIDIKNDGSFRAGERLSITNISFEKPVIDDFYKSHVWEKIKRILLIHYLRDKAIERLDYTIKFVNLFSPPKEDLKIIIEDYKKINDKIKEGLAHELSESDTYYLGACTKGASAESSLRPQYYGNHIPAKKRNYCFKQSYMNYVLQTYVLQDSVPCESIIKGEALLTFENYVIEMINSYRGRTDRQLCLMFGREYNNNKAQWVDLSYRMLDIKGNHAEEFVKANVVVKAIRIEQDGRNKESMSFPTVNFKELVTETWETSEIHEYFETTKLLFVIFKSNGSEYVLLGAQMWNMPYTDLNVIVKQEWEKIVDIIKNGVRFTVTYSNGKPFVSNNLPGKGNSKILHMRPHATQAAYSLKNGLVIGNIERDADELPNGEFMTKQSFWLNNSYILSQLKYK